MVHKNIKVCVYPSDVERITGKTYRQARLYLIKIKKHLEKEDHQLVSIGEFCSYTGLPLEEVMRCIKS